ncbi:FUSC family protein [Streptomyces sp. LP05-1]|uniref:FUSC family protein n=1 Tax=Streptomyces pyxinae TaxID=2970734 RepID=A0ABT2CLX8_9ACTN|nr:FUSC family protein [Streptomyces sp. LP05-1]MCS0637711.1 FUSC family protein [Streptomyces sp. LP05-1]
MREPAERAAIVRRAVRVTVAASAGFYPLRYGAGLPVPALYAFFAPIALGLLASVPGTGRQRAPVMLRALPAGLALAALGTVLAGHTWAAVAGMLAVGFPLAFAAVGGPRPAGAAPGLQLFYILACFPPYAPGELVPRLAGLAVGVLLLAACEALLLPDPPVPGYRERLAAALGTAAAPGAEAAGLRAAGRALRLSELPPAERPAGAGRTDRALAQAGGAVRRLLDQLATRAEWEASGPGRGAADDPLSAGLLGRVAESCAAGAAALRTGVRPEPDRGAGALETAMREFQERRTRGTRRTRPPRAPGETAPGEATPAGADSAGADSAGAARRRAGVLALAESARIAETAVGLAVDGRRTTAPEPRELFWYAGLSAPRLRARRIMGNLTPRSVWFQNAVRIALGLAAARLVAGSLELTHGFWVLLAVLTLGRTTAGATWRAVRQALAGNLVGAVAAGALLVGLGQHTDAYAALLAPGMLVAFALGPLLGVAYAQGLFTLVVATAFAQLAPAGRQLAEARILDVVTGSAIGLLCGLLAWPAGARREVRRTMAGLLRSCAALVPGTVDALLAAPAGSRPAPHTLPSVHRLRLAEAAYAQFRSEPPTATERPGDPGTDWHAVLILAHQMLLGAERLPRFDTPPATVPPASAARARAAATALVAEADRVAELFTARDAPGRRTPPGAPEPGAGRVPAAPRPPGTSAPPGAARASYGGDTGPGPDPPPVLVDLEVWLAGLGRQLDRIAASADVDGPGGRGREGRPPGVRPEP